MCVHNIQVGLKDESNDTVKPTFRNLKKSFFTGKDIKNNYNWDQRTGKNEFIFIFLYFYIYIVGVALLNSAWIHARCPLTGTVGTEFTVFSIIKISFTVHQTWLKPFNLWRPLHCLISKFPLECCLKIIQ